jgi:hypothetical protein
MSNNHSAPGAHGSPSEKVSKPRRRNIQAGILNLFLATYVLTAIFAWPHFLVSSRSALKSEAVTDIFIAIVPSLLLGFIVASRRPINSIQAVAVVLAAISLILAIFSYTYYAIGGFANFSHRLTRLDAFYVAFGNLTTAGSGNLYPITERSRALVTIQYGADIILFTGLISIILLRLSRRE